MQKFFRVSPFDTERSLVTPLFPSVRSCMICCACITARAVNCATAEISGVLFKERCLIKPTVLTHLISRKGTGFLPVLAARRLNSTGITPDPLVSLPGVVIVPAWSFFGVSFDARSRGAAKPDATWSHPIPTAALAMNRRRFQIVWPLAPL